MNASHSIWKFLCRTWTRFARGTLRFILLGCLLPASSGAAVLFDSIQFGESAVDPFGYAVGDLNNVYNQPAQRFVSAGTGHVDDISFVAHSTAQTVDFFVRLWSDSGNSPGVLLEELTAPSVGSILAEHTVLSSLHPLLVAGSTYWLSLSTTTTSIGQHDANSGLWRWSNGPFLGGNSIAVAFDSTSNGPWTVDTRDFQATMARVNATLVPEPGTWAFLAIGGLMLFFRFKASNRR